MTGALVPSGHNPEVALRARLSTLQGLLTLAMVMTETGDEHKILQLATSAAPSISRCRLQGAYLVDGSWLAVAGPCTDAEVRADLQAQFAVVTNAGGAVAIPREPWTWAFPLRSLEGLFGFIVVSADQEPEAGEQFTLRVLAQQTGVALSNALLHARERETAEELRSANAALNDSLAQLQRTTALHQRLTRLAAAGGGQQGVAEALHELTGRSIAIEDRHGRLRAWAGGDPPDSSEVSPPDRDSLIERAMRAGGPIRDNDRLVAVVHSRGDVSGVLALIDPERTAGQQEKVALEHGATVLAMEQAWLQSMAETDLRLRRDLVERLLSGLLDATTRARAEAFGCDLTVAHRVVVIECTPRRGGDAGGAFHAVRRAVRDCGLGTLLVTREAAFVLLTDADSSWEKLHAAVVAELGGGACRIGVGGLCPSPTELPRSLSEAQLAVRMQKAAGGAGSATCFDELGVYRLLANGDNTDALERYVQQWLGALVDYDTRKRSELVMTVSRYLEYGGSYEQTAQALGVHRSTVKYRLQRIREVSGYDLADPDICFNLQLATRAWQTLQVLRDLP